MLFFIVLEILKHWLNYNNYVFNNESKSRDSLHKLISQTWNKSTILSQKLFSKMVEKRDSAICWAKYASLKYF